MLVAYFDDSGTHDGSEVILLAGLVASEETWGTIEEMWLKILADEGVKRFHRTECEAGFGEFDLWPRPRRDHLYFKLRSTLDGVLLRSSHVIYRTDWDEVVVRQFPKLVPTLGSPYRMVLSECIQKTVLWASKVRPAAEKIAFRFDLRPQNTEQESRLGQLYAQHPTWSSRIDSFTFAIGESNPLLQAADLYAHDLYQQHTLRMRDPDNFKTQPHMSAMKGKIPDQRAGHLDRNWLVKYCNNLTPMLRRAGVID